MAKDVRMKKLRRFCGVKNRFYMVPVALAAMIYGAVTMVRTEEGVARMIPAFLLFAGAMGAGVMLTGGLAGLKRLNKKLKTIEEEGQTETLLKDFSGADNYFNRNLKLGHEYIFGNEEGAFCSYADIVRVVPALIQSKKSPRTMLYLQEKGDTLRPLCTIPDVQLDREQWGILQALLRGKNAKILFEPEEKA